LDFLVFEQLLDGLVVLLDEGISWGFEKFWEFRVGGLMSDVEDEIVVFFLLESCKYLVEIFEIDGFYWFVFGNFLN
jgi:hypothetical protein